MERLTVLAVLTDRTFPSNSNAPRSSGAACLASGREEGEKEGRKEREREFASVRLFSGARKYGASKASWPIQANNRRCLNLQFSFPDPKRWGRLISGFWYADEQRYLNLEAFSFRKDWPLIHRFNPLCVIPFSFFLPRSRMIVRIFPKISEEPRIFRRKFHRIS